MQNHRGRARASARGGGTPCCTSVACHRGVTQPASSCHPPWAHSSDSLPVVFPSTGLGRSRSGCRGLGAGKSPRMAGGMAGWGWQGRGMWLGSSVVKGGRLSEEITIKCGPGPSSLMCSSLERKLHFQSAFLRKRGWGGAKVVFWSLCSRSLSVLFTALGQIRTNLKESKKVSVLPLRARPF